MEIKWEKPTSRETDEPFGWQSLIALYVPKYNMYCSISYRHYILMMESNYSHSNVIIEAKLIKKPDSVIRIALIGFAGLLMLFLASCNGSGF